MIRLRLNCTSLLPLTLQELVLESGDGEQVLKQKVEQNQRVKLEVAVCLAALEAQLDDADHDLADVEALVGDVLRVHRIVLIGAVRELIDRLRGAVLNEVLGETLHDFVGFEADLRLARVNQQEQVVPELRVSNQVCEDGNVQLCH